MTTITGTLATGSTDCQCADCRAYREDYAEQAYHDFVVNRVRQNKAARAYEAASKLNDEHQGNLAFGERAVRDLKESYRGSF